MAAPPSLRPIARRIRRLAGRLLFALLVAAIVTYTVFPFYWAIVASLKSGNELFSASLLPADPGWENYRAIFRDRPFARSILNSLLVATATVAVSLALAAAAAFALGRITFRGRGALLLAILAVSMFPQIAILAGLFELIRALGLYNNLLALVFSHLTFTLPFAVWVLTGFMREMPTALEEAAMIDGATPFVVLTRIFLPLLAPALVTTGLLTFIVSWNEFLFALTFTLTDDKRTVPVAIALITGASRFELPWGQIMAASVTVTLPLIALVLVFQRRIIAGLAAGAVKG
ncbi:MAG: carbohydrate ABC transporter permease [Acetobacteraceae bacterium]|nr:carbohydrate ABC transporter permease [Acetobacteraceae bacterium]